MSIRSPLKPALLASAFGALLFAAGAAFAQDGGSVQDAAYSPESSETITITAPRYHVTPGTGLNLPEKVSLSQAVAFDDLDLRNGRDARELRHRVVEAARNVCAQLADAVPFEQAPGTSCFKTARADALLKADAAIRDARE